MADEASAPGGGKEVRSPGELRASHEDRDKVVEVLRTAAGDGRLTAEELDQRLDAALTARTYAELAVLTTDLPDVPGTAMSGPDPAPKDLIRFDCHTGSTRRDGRWVVPRRIEVLVTGGSVTLDFTQAVISQPSVQMHASVNSGSLTLVTKPGILVDADDVAIRSGTVRIRSPRGPDVPVTLRIDVSGQVGAGAITARPPRRTFWQWLLRRPGSYPPAP